MEDSDADPALAKAEPVARLVPSGFDPGERAGRVLVCGGRDYDDRMALYHTLDKLVGVAAIIQGDARGADRLAKDWARIRRIPQDAFPADWNKHGKAAGAIRNQQMLDEGMPDLVVAFPGGRGTADMVSRATRAGVKVFLPDLAGIETGTDETVKQGSVPKG